MNPTQENLLLRIMDKVGDKLEKQQTKWWYRAGIIYGILIFLITGLVIQNEGLRNEMSKIKETNNDQYQTLKLEIQDIKKDFEAHMKYEHNLKSDSLITDKSNE